MKIVVVGMGYVGIPIAALFAELKGFNVIGIQRRSERSGWKIDAINAGNCPIGGDEPSLAELIAKVVKAGSLRVVDDFSECNDADVLLIDVQTPVNDKRMPEYDSLREVAAEIGKRMKHGALIIIESTVAPGTTEYIVKPILERESKMKAGEDFSLVYSYERVTVGRLVHNLKFMPRIVGGWTTKCTERAMKFYENIVKAELLSTDCLTAEVAKVTENTYRDVNIAFANEVALICESLGVNVYDVRRFVNSLPHDPTNPAKNPYRMMHSPGAGVGGHCLPKDPWLLEYGFKHFGSIRYDLKVIRESRRVNDYMPKHMMDLIQAALEEKKMQLRETKICLLGFAFLEDSDDTRNTPALPLYGILKDKCEEVIVHDPLVKEFENVKITGNLEEAVKNSHCLVVITRHKEYQSISLDWLKKQLAALVIVDGRNLFDPTACIKAGFVFRGVGIGSPRTEQ